MTQFEVWAPHAKQVDVLIDEERLPMTPRSPAGAAERDGWWEIDVPSAESGADYAFSLDGGPARPDPRSPHQPNGVHGPSRVVDPQRFAWTDAGWRGRTAPGSVI